jgi:hypothetical protein
LLLGSDPLRRDGLFLGFGYAQVVVALLVAARLDFGISGAGGPAASGLIVSAIHVPIWWHVRFLGQVGSH